MKFHPICFPEFASLAVKKEDCLAYLAQLRWVDGFKCPYCNGLTMNQFGALYRCKQCRRQISATAGTIFHRSHIPLNRWFQAMWWLAHQKNGASALKLKRELKLQNYETAWLMLQKLRYVMANAQDKLSGSVEIDNTYIGKKTLIAVAVQIRKRISRIRIRRIIDTSSCNLHQFVFDTIEPGSNIYTDEWGGYNGIGESGYHHIIIRKNNLGSASNLMPNVQRVVSQVNQWLLGTYQGAVSEDHLDSYLNEYTFRFNRRKLHVKSQLFSHLLQMAVQTKHTEYQGIIKHVRGLKSSK